jgi:hypothetical protein
MTEVLRGKETISDEKFDGKFDWEKYFISLISLENWP